MKRRAFSLGALAASASAARPAAAALSRDERSTLQRYLRALSARRFDRAFGLLSSSERRYFGSAAHLQSVFDADRVRIASARILASHADARGVVAIVSERIDFFDHARQIRATALARAAYGIVREHDGVRVKDPYHPWRALAPAGIAANVDGIDVALRKASFFTGRIALLIGFANRSDKPVSILPYGRTTLCDERGRRYLAIESRDAALTDRRLFTGLRLPVAARYAAEMTFATPDRFVPQSLTLGIGPLLFDGADAPFDVALPALSLPTN